MQLARVDRPGPQLDEVRSLFVEYWSSFGFTPCFQGFDAELARGLLHIILSHHGTLENGSPVVPCTREATLVHMIDNLGGRLGSFDRLEKALPAGASWSSYDRALGSGAYFGSATTITAEDRRGHAEAA